MFGKLNQLHNTVHIQQIQLCVYYNNSTSKYFFFKCQVIAFVL